MPDRTGQQLDNYRLLRLLGAGSFGEVYLAEHIHRPNQPPVAIKILLPLAQDDPPSFLTEARTIRLKHPNIIQVLDFGVEGRTPFIVMEYAPNGTLRQRHPKGTRVPVDTVITYVKQVASALQYAHDERLIHRDVKPENMLIGAENQILLSDFGIATIAHDTSSQSMETMAGTIAYMAPEQIQKHPRPASDQYALGVVVYEWLCGARPFQGTFTEVAVKQATLPPPPLHEKVPTISPEMEQVVMTALAKDPKQRFGSVQAFAQALAASSSTIKTKEQWPGKGVTHYDGAAPQAYDQAFQPNPKYAVAYQSLDQAYKDLATTTHMQTHTLDPHNATPREKLAIRKKRHLSRRAVVIGTGGAIVLAAASAGLTWLLFPRTTPVATWYDKNYQYKKSITIDHTKVSGESNLSNFPVLISLTDPQLKTATNGGYIHNNNGYDIIFTDSTETTKLDHEIEIYTPTTGEIKMWVRVPALSASSDTSIYMYFGNNSAATSQENKTGVWDNSYQSVWHMGDNAANTMVKDSTSNENNGIAQQNTSNMTPDGKSTGALFFNGTSDYLSANTVTALQGDNSRTVSMWIKTSATIQQAFFDSGDINSSNQAFGLALTQQNGIGTKIINNSFPPINIPGVYLTFWNADVYIPGQTLTDNNWHHITVTLSGTLVSLYIDGAKPQGGYLWSGAWSFVTQQPFTLPAPPNTTNNPIWIGHSRQTFWFNGSSYFNGSISEVRISNTNRSSDWILTEYNNQRSPAAFYRVSALIGR